jgi:hypothetical protein
MWWHTLVIPAKLEAYIGGSRSRRAHINKKRCSKITSAKTNKQIVEGMAQVVESWYSKLKALNSNPRAANDRQMIDR